LIHDDLPAMDDDDFRRGKPSCHKAFDEATAILVGDGLQALAIELLLDKLPLTMSAQKTVVITKELVSANGFMGMISGQSLDLSELKNPNLSLDMLSFIHNLKTGKLIVACFNMAILASSDVGHIESEALKKFAYEIGLVFQMQDDYLDHYAPQSVLGKGASSDLLNEKVTFASLFSKDTLAEKINALYRDAIENLKPFGEQANDLIALTETLRLRSNGISE
jgi:farnesyl diphosphate synthase